MNIGIVTTWFERGAAYVSRQFMDVLSKGNNVFIYARGGEAYAIDNPKWNLPNVHWGKRSEGKSTYIDSTYIVNQLRMRNNLLFHIVIGVTDHRIHGSGAVFYI